MKRFAIVCFLLFALFSNAQKTEPTIDETFKFILYMIGESNLAKIMSSNPNKYEIEVYNWVMMSAFSDKITSILELSKISKIEKGELLGSDNNDPYTGWRLTVTYTEIIKDMYKGKPSPDTSVSNKNTFVFKDVNNRDRLFKALEHFKKLNGGVDVNLFDKN